jgi:hypothetical protein
VTATPGRRQLHTKLRAFQGDAGTSELRGCRWRRFISDRVARQLSWLGIHKDTFTRTRSGGAYKWHWHTAAATGDAECRSRTRRSHFSSSPAIRRRSRSRPRATFRPESQAGADGAGRVPDKRSRREILRGGCVMRHLGQSRSWPALPVAKCRDEAWGLGDQHFSCHERPPIGSLPSATRAGDHL